MRFPPKKKKFNARLIAKLTQEAASSTTSRKRLYSLSKFKFPPILKAIASNPSTPSDLLDLIFAKSDFIVRADIVKNPNFSLENAAHIAMHECDLRVLEAVATSMNTPSEILEITTSREEIMNARVVRKKAFLLSPWLVSFASVIAPHPNLPTPIIRKLSESSDIDILIGLSCNPSTPSDILSSLSKISDKSYDGNCPSYGVCGNCNTPPDILAELSDSSDDKVRILVSKNPNTPIEKIYSLLGDQSHMVRFSAIRNALMNSLHVPPHLAERLSNDDSECVKIVSCRLETLPIESIEILSRDENPEIRAAIASNPITPVHILEGYFRGDWTWRVMKGLSKNPNTPRYILEALSRHKLAAIRLGVAKNPNSPIEALTSLSLDKNPSISIISREKVIEKRQVTSDL